MISFTTNFIDVLDQNIPCEFPSQSYFLVISLVISLVTLIGALGCKNFPTVGIRVGTFLGNLRWDPEGADHAFSIPRGRASTAAQPAAVML